MRSLRAYPVFSLIVLATVVLFGLIGLMVLLMQLRPGFMGMAHGTELHHRVHDLTFAFLLAPAAVGMLAQLKSPSQNVAGQLMALIPWIALLLAFVLATTWLVFAPAPILGALTLTATILHPARRDFLRSFSGSRVNRVILALVIIAAVPLLAFASRNIGLQRTVTNDHAALGHYGFMAAFSFTVIGIGVLASLRLDGWRLTAWVAGVLPVLLGLASLVYPNNDSSLALVWALAAIAWGVGFIVAAELTRHAQAQMLPASRDVIPEDDIGPDRGSTTSTPRWVYVFGIIVIVLGVLFFILHVTGGGGPWRHMR